MAIAEFLVALQIIFPLEGEVAGAGEGTGI